MQAGKSQCMAGIAARRAPPRWSMPEWLAMPLAHVLTWVSRHVTGRAPLLPVDIVRTACWGAILYDCSKSERVLGLEYTPIEDAVRAAMLEVLEALPE